MRAIVGMLCLAALAGCAASEPQKSLAAADVDFSECQPYLDKALAARKSGELWLRDASLKFHKLCVDQKMIEVQARSIGTAPSAPSRPSAFQRFMAGMGSSPEGHVGAQPIPQMAPLVVQPRQRRQLIDITPPRTFTCSRPPAYARYHYGGPALRCREGY